MNFDIDRTINDAENRLTDISAYPVIGTLAGAAKILMGQPVSQLPIQAMHQLLIFVNTQAAAAQGLDLAAIQRYAQQQNYIVKLNPSAH